MDGVEHTQILEWVQCLSSCAGDGMKPWADMDWLVFEGREITKGRSGNGDNRGEGNKNGEGSNTTR